MKQKITLEEGWNIITPILDIPLENLFPNTEIIHNVANKGSSGHLLEHTLVGLNITSDLLDFSNGELKTVKWRQRNFAPDQTMFITMTNTEIDSLLSDDIKFEDTHLYKKLKHFILVPVVKSRVSGSKNAWAPEKWYYSHPYYINANLPQYKEFFEQIKQDYYFIRKELNKKLSAGGYLETTNGKYLQIRTKGQGGKNSICYSKIYNRNINESGANYSFYLLLDGVKEIKKIDTQLENAA